MHLKHVDYIYNETRVDAIGKDSSSLAKNDDWEMCYILFTHDNIFNLLNRREACLQ